MEKESAKLEEIAQELRYAKNETDTNENAANKVTARILFDVSKLQERVTHLQMTGFTDADIEALKREAPDLIRIQSSRVVC